MKSSLAMLLMVMLCGCSVPGGSTFKTNPATQPVSTWGLAPLSGVSGPVPVSRLLSFLNLRSPDDRYDRDSVVNINSECTEAEAVGQIELSQGWVFDPKERRFTLAVATHELDGGDSFGRPSARPVPLTCRAMVAVEMRFRRVGVSVSDAGGQFNGAITVLKKSVPDGVSSQFSQTSNRVYFEGVQTTGQVPGQNPQVNTRLGQKSAGFSSTFLAARLPGGMCRFSGQISVASFVGAGLDTASTEVPFQVDGPRGQWIRIAAFRSGDATIQGLWKQWGGATLSADGLELEVKVD